MHLEAPHTEYSAEYNKDDVSRKVVKIGEKMF